MISICGDLTKLRATAICVFLSRFKRIAEISLPKWDKTILKSVSSKLMCLIAWKRHFKSSRRQNSLQNTVGWPSYASSTLCPKRHYMHVISNMGTIWVVIRQISEGSATDLFILSILFYRTHQKHYIRFKQETIKKTLILLQGYVNISSLHNGVITLYILGRWVVLVFWHLVLHMLSPNITCHVNRHISHYKTHRMRLFC